MHRFVKRFTITVLDYVFEVLLSEIIKVLKFPLYSKCIWISFYMHCWLVSTMHLSVTVFLICLASLRIWWGNKNVCVYKINSVLLAFPCHNYFVFLMLEYLFRKRSYLYKCWVDNLCIYILLRLCHTVVMFSLVIVSSVVFDDNPYSIDFVL